MAHTAMVAAYLRELLDDLFGEDVVVQDNTHILPLAEEPQVRVVPGDGHVLRVEVRAPVARDVEPTPELFVALNDINAGLPYGRVYLIEDVVGVEKTVEGDELTFNSLDNAIRFCCWVVNAYGPDLVADFGGRTTGGWQADDETDPDVRDAVEPIGDDDAPTPPRGQRPAGVTAAGYL